MDIRLRLINIHRNLTRRIKRQIYVKEIKSPAISKYYEEYRDFLRQGYQEVVTKDILLKKVTDSDIVFVGDYHAFRLSQEVFFRLLRETLEKQDFDKKKPQGIVVGVEAFYFSDQSLLDEYISDSNTMSEKEFLQRVEYDKKWQFPWEQYKIFIEFARENKARVKLIGLNSAPTGKKILQKRDRYAARIISQFKKKYPQALFMILFGDLHISPSHLPKEVERLVKKRLNTTIIYQNSEHVYWQLVAEEREQNVDVVKISDNQYCIMSATPLTKFLSYANWLENIDEIKCLIHPNWCSNNHFIDFSSQIIGYINTICHFLNLPLPPVDNFTVLFTHDMRNLVDIAKRFLDERSIQELEVLILKGEGYFCPAKNMIWLSNFSINHSAEEATHYLHFHLSQMDVELFKKLKEDFYFMVFRECIGFLGSKIVNPKRLCYMKQDYEEVLENTRRRKPRDPRQKELRKISKIVLKFKILEEKFYETGLWKKRSAFNRIKDISVKLGVTHALGYMFGNKLYFNIMKSYISLDKIRNLILFNIKNKDDAFVIFLRMIELLKDLPEPYPSVKQKI